MFGYEVLIWGGRAVGVGLALGCSCSYWGAGSCYRSSSSSSSSSSSTGGGVGLAASWVSLGLLSSFGLVGILIVRFFASS